MTQVNMHEAKTHLSSLVERALAGEEIVIARAGKPLVQLTIASLRQPRTPGFAEGEFVVDERFFEPMTEEELDLWYK